MTFQLRLLLAHCATATVAIAATLGAGQWIEGQTGLVSGAAAGILIAAVLGHAAGRALFRALDKLQRAIAAGQVAEFRLTGISEIDTVAEQLRDAFNEFRQTAEDLRLHSELVLRDARSIPDAQSVIAQASSVETSAQQQAAPDAQVLATIADTASANIERILALANEISQRMQVVSSGAQEQAEAVVQTTSSVEQMSTHIDTISQNAEGANKAAVAARESAAKGQELVQELIRGMDRIRLHVDTGGRKLQGLGERSQEIGSIVETIGSISARTDMLALNASIESVRAGEHGRGFAVVAEEVRKLAEQTAAATREVGHLIESIQVETQESIAAIADERAQVAQEVQRVSEAGVALDHISQTSTDSAQRVGEISRATLHQLRGTQEVVLAMQQISNITRRIREGANGSRDATTTLAAMACQLDTALAPLYRISQDHHHQSGFDRGRPARPGTAHTSPTRPESNYDPSDGQGFALTATSEEFSGR